MKKYIFSLFNSKSKLLGLIEFESESRPSHQEIVNKAKKLDSNSAFYKLKEIIEL